MRNQGFVAGLRAYVELLRSEGRYASAKSYQDALRSFGRFMGGKSVRYSDINPGNLRRYQFYLLDNGMSWNTVSTYMRRLRRIYNVAAKEGRVPYVQDLFQEVFTGVESRRKLALSQGEFSRLMRVRVEGVESRQAQLALCLMFQYEGMAFVDLAHLTPENLKEGLLDYKRSKTGSPIRVSVPALALGMSEELASSSPEGSRFLYPFLSGTRGGEDAYREYSSALSRINRGLKKLALAAGVSSPVTTYTIRHTFATMLKEMGTSIEVISELMGHKSVSTTQIYLKSFSLERLSAVNAACFDYVYNYVSEGE